MRSTNKLSLGTLALKIKHLPETGEGSFSVKEKFELIEALRMKHERNHRFTGVKSDKTLKDMEEYFKYKSDEKFYEIAEYYDNTHITRWFVDKEMHEWMRRVIVKTHRRPSPRYNEEALQFFWFCTRKWKVQVKPIYIAVHHFSQWRCAVQDATSKLWWFIDRSGKKITALQRSRVGDFSEGKAWVRDEITRKYTYINLDGQFDSEQYIYDDANDYDDGVALVSQRGEKFKRDLIGNLTPMNEK